MKVGESTAMEQEIYSWVKNIVIYMIINTIVMNLLGNKSYKKYVSIVSGMILVLIVISPLVKLLKLDDSLDYFLKYNDFTMESIEFKEELKHVTEQQDEEVFAEYEKKIKSQVSDLLLDENVYMKTCSITFDKDAESDTFGAIIGMDVTGSTDQISQASGNNLQIENIEIPKIEIGEYNREKEEKLLSPLEISIKNQISNFYNMEQGNINISIQGG